MAMRKTYMKTPQGSCEVKGRAPMRHTWNVPFSVCTIGNRLPPNAFSMLVYLGGRGGGREGGVAVLAVLGYAWQRGAPVRGVYPTHSPTQHARARTHTKLLRRIAQAVIFPKASRPFSTAFLYVPFLTFSLYVLSLNPLSTPSVNVFFLVTSPFNIPVQRTSAPRHAKQSINTYTQPSKY